VGAVDGSGEKQNETANASLLGKLGNFKALMAKKPESAKAKAA
jgi:hypothetical protein